MKFYFLIIFLVLTSTAFAQQYYNVGGAAPVWKSAVPNVGSLPAGGNTIGDTRIELTSFGIYVWDGAAWQPAAGGGGGGGTVTTVSVVSANGLAGTVATPGTTPAITISTSVNGLVKGNGTAFSAAVANTDYQTPLTFSNSLVNAAGTVTLVNDSGAPGATKYYGTNGASTLGYFSFPATVSSLSATLPISVSAATGAVNISETQAAVAADGWLSSVDWNTFNNKQPTISTSTAPANQFGTGFTAPNTFTYAQPAFSNLSGSIAASQMLALPSADIYVGTAGNQPAAVAMSGDASITNTGSLTVSNYIDRVYVDFIAGNDGTGTGTPIRPWKTLQHACTTIAPTINQPVTIFLSGGNNDSDAAPITCPPNITIMGDYPIQVSQPLTITGGATNDSIGLVNLIFVGAVTWIRNDATVMGASLTNTQFFSGPVFKQNGAGSFSITANNSVTVNMDLKTGGTGSFFTGHNFLGTTTFEDANSSAYYQIMGGYSDSAMSFAGGPTVYFSGMQADVPFGYTLTAVTTGNGSPVFQTDSGSIPPTVVGAPTYDFISQSSYTNYSAAVPGNWAPAPTQVASALDQLAARASSAGTVSTVSVVSANGFSGTVANPTTTPAITMQTTVTGLLKGNGTAVSAAVSNTDYQAPISTSAAVVNQFLTGFTAPNTFTRAQPAFTDISGTATIGQGGTGQTTANAAFNALSPMTTLGDIEYEDATPKAVRLAGNTTATKQFLNQTGTGAVSAAPIWSALVAADIPNLDFSKITTGTVPIGQGGTGQTTKTTGFDALSPLTTKGDLVGYDNTHNVRFPVGADGFILSADSTQASGLKWVSTGGGVTNVTASAPIASSGGATPNISLTGIVATANGGTNHGDYTQGSVAFAGAGGTSLTENNANFFWDNATQRLGLGTATPNSRLQVSNGEINQSEALTDSGGAGLIFSESSHTTVDGSNTTIGVQGVATGVVDVGTTNDKTVAAILGTTIRGNGADDGTLHEIDGAYALMFHNSGAAGTTDKAITLGSTLINQKGTITDLYDIKPESVPAGGSVTNHYGIYVENSPFGLIKKSWIGDRTTIGGTSFSAPTAELDVNGNARVRGLTVAGPVESDSSGNLTSSANLSEAVSTKNANYTVLISDQNLMGDASGGAFTFTLPASAASFSSGRSKVFTFVKADSSANIVSISAAGADTIQGVATIDLNTQYQTITVITDGTGAFYVK